MQEQELLYGAMDSDAAAVASIYLVLHVAMQLWPLWPSIDLAGLTTSLVWPKTGFADVLTSAPVIPFCVFNSTFHISSTIHCPFLFSVHHLMSCMQSIAFQGSL